MLILERGRRLGDGVRGLFGANDDPPVVALDQRRHGGAITAQRLHRARFVGSHEAGISFNIGT